MDIKFKPPGGTLGLNPITGDTIINWDTHFAQNFNNPTYDRFSCRVWWSRIHER
jgi:hypothetical protein